MSGCQGWGPQATYLCSWVIHLTQAGVRAGYLDRCGGGAQDQCLAHSPSGKGDRRHSEWGTPRPSAAPASVSLFQGNVPEPAVGDRTAWDEVQLEWAVSGSVRRSLSTRITDTPGRGESSMEVGVQTLPPQLLLEPGLRKDTSPGGHQSLFLHRFLSREPGHGHLPGLGGTQNMRSPSWPTIATGPAVTLCPSVTPR